MYREALREVRHSHTKARRLSRHVAREAHMLNPLSPRAKTGAYVVGGLAAAGVAYLIYQKATTPSTAPASSSTSTSTSTTTTTTPTTPAPSTAPAVPPAVATPAVVWTSSNFPWRPPATPANLPAGYSITSDLASIDPMFVAMAQSALQIISQASITSSLLTAYSGPIDGSISSAYTTSLISFQAAVNTAINGYASYPGHHPHTDGTLDSKTLALLLTYSVQAVLGAGNSISPYRTGDTVIAQMAVDALTNMVNTASMQVLVPGVTLPINLNTALSTFQGVFAVQFPSFPISGYANTQIDWATWGLIVGVAG